MQEYQGRTSSHVLLLEAPHLKNVAHSALTIAVAALFSGCGGSQTQPPVSLPGTLPQTAAIADAGEIMPRSASYGKSWMVPEAGGKALIYAVNGCAGTCVLTYPNGKLVGRFYTSGGSAACSDANGNVFIPRNSSVTEWPHGATMPTQTFTVPGYNAAGCAVDPMTGDLAVVFSGTNANVAVFAPGSQTPAQFDSHVNSYYCGYDDAGNLFVSGRTKQGAAIAELANGALSFELLTINGTLGNPGQMEWDGSNMTYENLGPGIHNINIARLSISGLVAAVIGTTNFNSKMQFATQSWLYKGTVLVPFGKDEDHINRVGLWPYPAGGAAKSIFKFPNEDRFEGITISVAPSR